MNNIIYGGDVVIIKARALAALTVLLLSSGSSSAQTDSDRRAIPFSLPGSGVNSNTRDVQRSHRNLAKMLNAYLADRLIRGMIERQAEDMTKQARAALRETRARGFLYTFRVYNQASGSPGMGDDFLIGWGVGASPEEALVDNTFNRTGNYLPAPFNGSPDTEKSGFIWFERDGNTVTPRIITGAEADYVRAKIRLLSERRAADPTRKPLPQLPLPPIPTTPVTSPPAVPAPGPPDPISRNDSIRGDNARAAGERMRERIDAGPRERPPPPERPQIERPQIERPPPPERPRPVERPEPTKLGPIRYN